MDPPTKKPRLEEADGVAEEPKRELEEDSLSDARPKLEDGIMFHTQDTTLNVMQSPTGNLLMTLTDGGLQHLVAGARANVGVKTGRYMFEARIVEVTTQVPANPAMTGRQQPFCHPCLRIGFSTEKANLCLGETHDSVCFDSDCWFIHNRQRLREPMPQAPGMAADIVLAVVLNLNVESLNANTVSLFRDGVRIGQPQPIPEHLHGKTLYPSVSYKSVTVHVNFGSVSMRPLPFSCRMIQDAALEDIHARARSPPKDGKYEIIFPVGLPDEGTFDALDLFLENHPGYTELSNRAMLDWCLKSGLVCQKAQTWKNSVDRPDAQFGISSLDDGSAKRLLDTLSTSQERNLVVMEAKSILLKEERQVVTARYGMGSFKRTALVMFGEPPPEFKQREGDIMLKQKQDTLDAEFKKKKEQEQRQKLWDEKQKTFQKAQRAAERKRKRLEREKVKPPEDEEKKKEREARAAARKDAMEKGELSEEERKEIEEEERIAAEDEEKRMKELKEEEANESEEEKEEEPLPDTAMEDEHPPKAELTDDEKKLWFRARAVSDVTAFTLATTFSAFTLPQQEDGFDEVRFDWAEGAASQEYLKKWILNRKVTTRIEDLQPSEWFHVQMHSWAKERAAWEQAHRVFKEPAPKEETKGEDEKKADEEPASMDVDKKLEPPIDRDKLDIFGIEDITNIGRGELLSACFEFEDWALMTLRFEMHLLVHSFRRDAKDPERAGIHKDHISFYYNKYFKRTLNPKLFGVESFEALLDLVKDTVYLDCKNAVMVSLLPEDVECLDIFAKLTEEMRRERQRRVDAGDETARIKFQSSHGGVGYAKLPNVSPGMQAGWRKPTTYTPWTGGAQVGPNGFKPAWQQPPYQQAWKQAVGGWRNNW